MNSTLVRKSFSNEKVNQYSPERLYDENAFRSTVIAQKAAKD